MSSSQLLSTLLGARALISQGVDIDDINQCLVIVILGCEKTHTVPRCDSMICSPRRIVEGSCIKQHTTKEVCQLVTQIGYPRMKAQVFHPFFQLLTVAHEPEGCPTMMVYTLRRRVCRRLQERQRTKLGILFSVHDAALHFSGVS